MRPARQRDVRFQPDGQGMFEVRLVLRYEDGNEREDAKREGFLWDVPLKEWYQQGLTHSERDKLVTRWREKIDAIPHDRPAAPFRHAGRTNAEDIQAVETIAPQLVIARLKEEIVGLKDRMNGWKTRAEEAEIALLAREDEPGLYKATCPGCGEDVFVEVEEAQRI